MSEYTYKDIIHNDEYIRRKEVMSNGTKLQLNDFGSNYVDRYAIIAYPKAKKSSKNGLICKDDEFMLLICVDDAPTGEILMDKLISDTITLESLADKYYENKYAYYMDLRDYE